ncbi:MAG: site-specific DNA-methyltransferase [Rhodopseudomonas sp.]|uniref:DNA-methyltransferase n=1 Tax=Rhodopseudomonas sp. TaxID=1078 RepID=UPI0039E69145
MAVKREGRVSAVKLIEGDVLDVLSGLPRSSKYNLILSSPPYNIGKDYERDTRRSLDQYVEWLDQVISALVSRLSPNGSICWQVGNYVKDGESFPLDIYLYDSFKSRGLQLRNRIVWRFNFGLHSSKRFSGRYETLMWFTKSNDYKFNLDPIRIPQLYPGKRHSARKGGLPSGNRLGKNPSDYWEFSAEEHFLNAPVWDIPNVKANHPEKTIHPCQFPVELAERCVLALTGEGDAVLDPFLGVGTTAVAALKHKRLITGIDKDPEYLRIARTRIKALERGALKIRPSGKPVASPRATDKVARVPEEWLNT